MLKGTRTRARDDRVEEEISVDGIAEVLGVVRQTPLEVSKGATGYHVVGVTLFTCCVAVRTTVTRRLRQLANRRRIP